MTSCAVATCYNTYKKCKDKNIIFHRFPQKNSDLAKQWILKCRRKDEVNVKNARICSEHFLENDYVDDMRNRLLGLPQRRQLKEIAVPHLKIPGLNTDKQISARSERQKKRVILQNAHERLKTLSPCTSSVIVVENNEDEMETNHCENCNSLEKEIENLKLKLNTANDNIQILRKEKQHIVKNTSQKMRRYDHSKNIRAAEMYKLKTKIHSLTKENTRLKNLTEYIRNVFSETQIDALMGKKNVKWTSEDVSKAIVARAISSKSYDFWKEKMNIPMPSDSTLKRWYSKITCSPDVEDVLLFNEKEQQKHEYH